jgi:hypothetical protein
VSSGGCCVGVHPSGPIPTNSNFRARRWRHIFVPAISPPPDIALSPPPRAPCKPYQNQIRGSRSNWRRRRGTYSRRNRIGSREPLRRNLGSDSCCRQCERFSGVSDMGSFSSAGNVGGAVAAQARNWSN